MQRGGGLTSCGSLVASCPSCSRRTQFKALFTISKLAGKLCDELRSGADVWSLDCCICNELAITNRVCPTCSAVYCNGCFKGWQQECKEHLPGFATCAVCRCTSRSEDFVHDRLASKSVRKWLQSGQHVAKVRVGESKSCEPKQTCQYRTVRKMHITIVVCVILKIGSFVMWFQSGLIALAAGYTQEASVLVFSLMVACILRRKYLRHLVGLLVASFALATCYLAFPHVALQNILGVVPVHVLASPDMVALIAANAAGSNAGQWKLIDGGWLPSLVMSLHSNSRRSRGYALESLSSLSGLNMQTGKLLAEAGIIQPLTALLRTEDTPNFDAIVTLRNMASSTPAVGRMLFHAGLPEILFPFVSREEIDLDLRLQIVGGIAGMMLDNCRFMSKAEFAHLYSMVPMLIGWLPATTNNQEQWLISGLYAIGRCHPKLKARVLEMGLPHFHRISQNPLHYQPTTVLIASLALHEFLEGVV